MFQRPACLPPASVIPWIGLIPLLSCLFVFSFLLVERFVLFYFRDIIEQGVLPPLAAAGRSEPRTRARAVTLEFLALLSQDPTTRASLCEANAATAFAGSALLQNTLWMINTKGKGAGGGGGGGDYGSGNGGSAGGVTPVMYHRRKSVSDDCGGSISSSAGTQRARVVIQEEEVTCELFHCLHGLANMLEPITDENGNGSNMLPVRAALKGDDDPLSDEPNNTGKISTFKECVQQKVVEQTATDEGMESLLQLASIPYNQLLGEISYTGDSSSHIGMYDILLETYRALVSLCPLLLSEASSEKGLVTFTKDVLLHFCDFIQFCTEAKDSPSGVWEELLLDALGGVRSLAAYAPLRDLAVEKSLSNLFQMKHNRKESPMLAQAAHQVCIALQFSPGDLERAGNDANTVLDWWGCERSTVIQVLSLDELFWSIYYHWKNAFDEAQDVLLDSYGESLICDTQMDFFRKYFRNVTSDALTVSRRQKVVRQYCAVYQGEHTTRSREERKDGSFHRFYNKDWILAHDKSIKKLENTTPGCFDEFVPNRVQAVLDFYMPSRAIQSSVLPLFHIQPGSYFDFRSMSMPERSYFSFRREGQILSRLCEEFARDNTGDKKNDTHYWSLSFVDSTFGGEFAETLVHALYRCPVLNAISFRSSTGEDAAMESADNKTRSDSAAVTSPLPYLVGSLPPWVTYFTCDNALCPTSLKEFLDVFVSLGKVISKKPQSNLQALSIQNTPHFHRQSVSSLAETIWRGGFPSLKLLDLSGNIMGGAMCGELLAALYAKDSRGTLEKLDLSGNDIGEGTAVLDAFRLFIGDKHLQENITLGNSVGRAGQPLKHLFLSNNKLSAHFVSELLSFLRGDALNLKTLDLSDNNLTGNTSHRLSNLFSKCLSRNTSLIELNLSKNQLSVAFLQATHDAMCSPDSWSKLAFIRLETNKPPFDEHHIAHLNNSLKRGRKEYVELMFGPQQDEDEAEEYVDDRDAQEDSNGSADIPRDYSERSLVKSDKSGAQTNLKAEEDVALAAIKNKLTVLFSAPLCCRLADNSLKPIDVLDLELERDLLFNCFKEASQDIELEFDTATTDRLSACLSKRCSCLHFSGHGHPNFLTFEDGKGGLHGVKVENLKQRLVGNDGTTPFQFVFVSACHSMLAGQTFVDAGTHSAASGGRNENAHNFKFSSLTFCDFCLFVCIVFRCTTCGLLQAGNTNYGLCRVVFYKIVLSSTCCREHSGRGL
jgi:hypothetical protein